MKKPVFTQRSVLNANSLKSCLVIFLMLFALTGCDKSLKSPAEKAIEEQQNKVWLEHLDLGKMYAKRWKDLNAIKADNYNESVKQEFLSLIVVYKAWKVQVDIDSKVTPVPDPIKRLINSSDKDWDEVYITYQSQKVRLENEKNEKIKAERDRVQKEAESQRIFAEEERRKQVELEDSKRQKLLKQKILLEASILLANQDLQSYEERRTARMRNLGNQAIVVKNSQGFSIEWGDLVGNQVTANVKIQNSGLRGGQYAPINELFFNFTIWEAQSEGKCSYASSKSYSYKTSKEIFILPTRVKDVEILIPRFFEIACVSVSVEG